MTELSSAKKQQLWEAVYLRPEPPAPDIVASEGTPAITNDEEQKAITTERPSTPPSHEASSDILGTHRSPPTPTRRGQSSTASAGSAFVRRQLGGMLRSCPSSRSARTRTSTTSIPESSEGTVEGGAGGQSDLGGPMNDDQGINRNITRGYEVLPSGKEDAAMKRRGRTSMDKVSQSVSSHDSHSCALRSLRTPHLSRASLAPHKNLLPSRSTGMTKTLHDLRCGLRSKSIPRMREETMRRPHDHRQ